MKSDPFSRVPRRRPASLVDLAETKTPEATRAFIEEATRIAEAAGGRVAIANEAIAPMIVPDERNPESDSAIRGLVVSDYPTATAAKNALDQRSEGIREFDPEDIRTYVARPVDRFESWFGRNLPHTLGRIFRQPVPTIENTEAREALIESALVLGEQPNRERWRGLAERAGDLPIWMVNFLDYRKTAVYAEDAGNAAPSAPISGARAYRNYGQGMISSLAAVGGRIAWSGHVQRQGQVTGRDDGSWHQVAIAIYPSPAAMMTMLALPKYRAAHVHRDAALARTRLLASQPWQATK